MGQSQVGAGGAVACGSEHLRVSRRAKHLLSGAQDNGKDRDGRSAISAKAPKVARGTRRKRGAHSNGHKAEEKNTGQKKSQIGRPNRHGWEIPKCGDLVTKH